MLRTFSTLSSYGFRAFFVAAGSAAVLLIPAWLGLLHGWRWPGAPNNILAWHVHEMLFGFVLAVIAGFLLTAVAAWTGRPAVHGPRLAALVLAWLVARVAVSLAGALPGWLLLLLALGFPALLAVTIGHEITAAGNRRNLPLVGIVALIPLLDALYLPVLDGISDSTRPAGFLMLHLTLLLIAIIGGRVIPAFSANWLRQTGGGPLPRSWPWLERLAIVATIAVGLSDSLLPNGWLPALLAAVAVLAHAGRLVGWRGWRTWRNPLLAILHLGYAWLPLGYGLLALAAAGTPVTRSAALHALTVGAIATMVMAMMTRVSLGHTGRSLHASPTTVLAYGLLTAAALARVGAGLLPAHYLTLLNLAGGLWVGAFGLFLWVYLPILCQPRSDWSAERSQPINATRVRA